jgi:hypothetical protein
MADVGDRFLENRYSHFFVKDDSATAPYVLFLALRHIPPSITLNRKYHSGSDENSIP